VCEELGRDWIGIDLDMRNVDIYERRRAKQSPSDDKRQLELFQKERRGMEKIFVKSLTTNLKGVGSVELGPKVLVVGGTRTGKSGLVDALSILVTGSARTEGLGKRPEVLAGLVPGGEPLTIEAVLSDGQGVQWTPKGKPLGSLVSGAVWDILYGDPKRVAAAVVSAVPEVGGGPLEALFGQVSTELPRALHQPLADLFGQVLRDFSGGYAAAIKMLQDHLRSEMAAATKAVKVVEAQTEQTPPLSDADRALLAVLTRLAQHAPDFDLAALRTRLIGQSTQATGVKAGAEQVLAGDAQGAQVFEQLSNLALGIGTAREIAVAAGVAELLCPCCGQHARVEMLSARYDQIQAELRRLSDGCTARRQAEAQRLAADRVLADIQQAAVTAQQVLTGTGLTLDAATPQVLRDRHKALSERDRMAQAAPVVRAVTRSVAVENDVLSAIGKALSKVQVGLAKRARETVEMRVNRALPPDVRFTLDEQGETGLAPMIKWSETAPVHFRALSGSERATVAMAISGALSGEADSLRLAVVDDVGLDQDMLRVLVPAAEGALAQDHGPTQVVITTLVWSGKYPDGWTVVELGKKRVVEPRGLEAAKPVVATLDLPVIGRVTREGVGDVPVYWLGEHKRVSSAVLQRLAGAPEGSYGVALSGEKRTLKISSRLYGSITEAPQKPGLAAAIQVLVDRFRAGGDGGTGGDGGNGAPAAGA
jgi:hypothetical protein